MSVDKNLILGAVIPTVKDKRAESPRICYSVFPRLAQRRNQLEGTLSGGEQQIPAIARSLMLRPWLLMLDEPSLGLAPMLVKEVYAKVKEIRKLAMAVLLVEQNGSLPLGCIDHGYVIEHESVLLSA